MVHVVGFNGEADTVIKYLTEESDQLEVISIIGMPGLGKTTLAWKIFCDPRIQSEFPTRIWVNVTQNYNIKHVFLTILKNFTQQDLSGLNENELAHRIRLHLENEKFLLVMDDVWTGGAWTHIKVALPMSNKFGKVIVTTRDARVAWIAGKREPHRLGFLELEESWKLLQLEVFSKLNACPDDLKVVGKKIAKKCGGVPLAIVVMGEILCEKLSRRDRKVAWENVSASVSACIHSDDEQRRTRNRVFFSYNKLPPHLRECFLYLGMFPRDSEISARRLTLLWIAEGFIQQKHAMSKEDVAEEYLEELIATNLVMVGKTKPKGEVKTCRVHDMIREFCKTQAVLENKHFFKEVKKATDGTFYPIIDDLFFYYLEFARRLCVRSEFVVDFLRQRSKSRRVWSFLCLSEETIVSQPECIALIADAFKDLKVLDATPIKLTGFPAKIITKLRDLKYIALSVDQFNTLPAAVAKLGNLQTIRIETRSHELEVGADICKMMQLRHFKTKAAIVITKNARGEGGKNLQTLSRLSDSARCCWEQVLIKASNLKNLGIRGRLTGILDSGCLARLLTLKKLKLIYDVFPEKTYHVPSRRLPPPGNFPPNLRILKISSTLLDWEQIAPLGKLPFLEVLKLKEKAFMGKVWEAMSGSFPSLEALHIAGTDLEIWTLQEGPNHPFPKLRCLILNNCDSLKEIPSELEKRLEVLDFKGSMKSIV